MAAAVSRSKRPLEDLQEGEQALQPDFKKQRCSSPSPSPESCLASAVPFCPSSGEAGDDSDLDDSLLERAEWEPPDSPYHGTPEEDDVALADDPETNSGNVLCNVDVSPEPLPPTGLSVPPSRGLPHSTSLVNPEKGSNTSIDSQNQIGLRLSSNGLGLQDAMPSEAGGFSLKKGNSISGTVAKEATQMVGEVSLVGGELMAKRKCATVATDGPSEGQALVEQGKVGGESASNVSCETQGESASATEFVPEHPIAAQNESCVEEPGPEEPEEPGLEESRNSIPADSRSNWISIPEEELQLSKEKYIESVLAHAQRDKHLIGEVNELHALMRKVAFEYRPWQPRHPTDLTVRNYAQRANREIQKCTLKQWVNRNQRHFLRFKDIPDKFQRSPVPSF
ncbi:S100P-binding protein isoform X2 [Eublepharis macularius]|uniref:S100P-binding protein n=1 Tax=Eublepharis macularius TaxID=481883 RepID=A0AA97KCY3_EUBMA|nr:S100P-binding protein isoform X2 [Eublepharis macularius]